MPTEDDANWSGPPHGTIESRLGGSDPSALDAAYKKWQAGEMSDNEFSSVRARTQEACHDAEEGSERVKKGL
jgi:hypothetical protein